MEDIQRKAAAAGFLHALKESRDVRDQWVTYFATKDWAGVRGLIGRTLGLARTPSEEDLAAMRIHTEDRLLPQRDELAAMDERIVAACICNGADPWHPGG